MRVPRGDRHCTRHRRVGHSATAIAKERSELGHAKELAERQFAQGWSFTDGWVCAGCVDDYALQSEIEAAAEPDESCTFCGQSPAAELDVLLEAFVDGLWSEYGDADDEGVSYESREGGYQWGRKWDTWELVDEFWNVLAGEGLLDAVREAVHDRVWVERNFAVPRKDEALSAGWARFCEAVQHETRYVFWLIKDPDEETAEYTGKVPASRILYELGKLLLDLELLVELPAGYSLWRARTHEQEHVEWGPADLGTVPKDKASEPNRMSPAGIPLFYGSEDLETAVAEVVQRKHDPWVTGGLFITSRSSTMVDFTRLPEAPSMFDARNRHRRRPLLFLHHFVDEVKKPARAMWEQLDYVPTQVMTEYLLRIFLDGQVISGILYPSAQTGRVSAALEVQNVSCVDQVEGWEDGEDLRLGLEAKSRTTQLNPHSTSATMEKEIDARHSSPRSV
jgi:hypothetical protein